MALGYLFAALLATLVAVFALQNSTQTSVRFLVWTLQGLPVAAVALAALAIGLVAAGLPLWVRSWRWHSRARSAEARVAMLEQALAERESRTASAASGATSVPAPTRDRPG